MANDYDPRTGGFISRNPIGLTGGINTNEYALDSTGWIDPVGLANTTDGTGNSVPLNEFGIPDSLQFQPKQNITTPYQRDSACGLSPHAATAWKRVIRDQEE